MEALARTLARGQGSPSPGPSPLIGAPRPYLRGLRPRIVLRVPGPWWVYQHMIEEYARHNGHADVLRERVDGVTGV